MFALEESHGFFPFENWLIFSITVSQKSRTNKVVIGILCFYKIRTLAD